MARPHLDRCRAHALRHAARQIGIDGPILGRDCVEARLQAPGRVLGPAGEQRLVKRLLHRVQDLRLCGGPVSRKVPQERRLGQPSFITIENDPGRGGRRREPSGECRVVLSGIGGARGDVDKRRDIRIDPRLGHNHAGEGMPHQHRRSDLPSQNTPGLGHCVGERRQRILDRGHVEPHRLQTRNDLGLARSIGKQSVNHDDVLRLGQALGPCQGWHDGHRRSSDGDCRERAARHHGDVSFQDDPGSTTVS
jgi:hypothetical protein